MAKAPKKAAALPVPAAPAAPVPKKAARTQKNMLDLGKQKVAVYASPKIAHAMKELTEDMSLYEGVRFTQILEAVYKQGNKDGARNAFEQIHAGVKAAEKAVPHQNPGKPKKR
ncbi:hypothetical protein JVX96_24215 [Variovorax sp. PDNC026]|uniref:hypothetical protein n=1 Tax=Variovorax sp. PDNC026 TaxID=2811425 RepID=UPI001966A259|nr:hypothetical protein [Variovorax sp. PDNC026]QRY31153.1 hypothetical protein JVX96_24215 [Variovorax sp. PDNC026]